jgi:acetolactate synthase regulatory subunit
MVTEHVLTCHRKTTLNSIALLSTNGRVFKHRCFLTLGQKMLECKSEQRVNIKFLVKLKKSVTETFQLLTEA